jgi:hypothetical protein
MLRHFFCVGALLLMNALPEEAIADCSTNQVVDDGNTNNNLSALLTNNTVCDATATYDGVVMGIQEEHRNGGELWDFKKGSADPIDPTALVGHWSVSGTGANTVVNYNYLSGDGNGSYRVYANGGSYDFCNGSSSVATVTVVGGTAGCAGGALINVSGNVPPNASANNLKNDLKNLKNDLKNDIKNDLKNLKNDIKNDLNNLKNDLKRKSN